MNRHLLPTPAAEFAEPGRPEFQLDVEQRCGDLMNLAGLTDIRAEIAHWTTDLTTAQVRALYASMAVLRRLPPPERDRRLEELTQTADEDFGGLVQRPFVTALYLGQRPPLSAQ